MSITAIVTVSKYNENPRNAIKSLLNSHNRFKTIFIIDPLNEKDKVYYDQYIQDQNTFKDHEIDICVYNTLNEKDIETKYVLYIPPECVFKDSAIEKLQQETKNADVSKTHFGLNTGIQLNNWSFFYGYMLVVSFIYFIWSKYEQTKLFKQTDLRMVSMISNGRHTYLAKSNPNGLLKYVHKPNINKIIIPNNQKISIYKPKTNGLEFVHQFLNKSGYLKLNWFYWIPYIRLWTIVFGIYWITSVLMIQQCVKFVLTKGATIYEPFAQILTLLCIIFWLITVYSTSKFISFKHLVPMTFINVFWVFTFPLMLVTCRMIKYNEDWN